MVKVHPVRQTRQQPAPMVTWVQVPDAQGRIHMEMRWHLREEHRTAHRHSAA